MLTTEKCHSIKLDGTECAADIVSKQESLRNSAFGAAAASCDTVSAALAVGKL